VPGTVPLPDKVPVMTSAPSARRWAPARPRMPAEETGRDAAAAAGRAVVGSAASLPAVDNRQAHATAQTRVPRVDGHGFKRVVARVVVRALVRVFVLVLVLVLVLVRIVLRVVARVGRWFMVCQCSGS
jgi:hypothetical protein